MDPQQRKLLEVVYECFESAGESMETLAGANIGCYVGDFTADFASMQNTNPDLFTRYSATGMGATFLANRLSHVLTFEDQAWSRRCMPIIVILLACGLFSVGIARV